MKNAKKVIPLMLLTAIAASVLTMSFAWFITNSSIELGSEHNVSVEVGNDVSISVLKTPGDADHDEVWSNYGSKIEFDADSQICDVTGNGISFQSPTSVSKTTGEPKAPMNVISADNHDGYYYEFSLKAKCNFTTGLYLAEGSYVKPASAATQDSEAERTSTGKLFPADYIAGAVRVALLEDVVNSSGVKTGENLVQIWIPNDKYETTFKTDASGRRPTGFFLNGFREETYGYQVNNATNDAIVNVNYTDTDYLTNKVVVGNHGVLADPNTQMAKHSLPVISFANDGSMQEKRFTIRFWIEGTDREANDVTNMGKVDYYFKFVTLNKVESDTTADAALANARCTTGTEGENTVYKLYDSVTSAYYDADSKIEYSFDGIEWSTYTNKLVFPVKYERRTNSDGSYKRDTETNEILLNETVLEKATVYVKHAEELSQRHGNYATVTVPIPAQSPGA